jgi:hypothetical protein
LELHALRHEARDEMHVAAQPIELGHDYGASASARFCERSSELGTAVERI